jgi:large subunit ribosomal protein L7e
MPSFVPESVLKKRRTAAEIKAKREADEVVATKKAADNKASMIKRAETYVAEYKTLENDNIRLRREAKASGSFFVPAEPKLAFVVRIRGASIPRLFFLITGRLGPPYPLYANFC